MHTVVQNLQLVKNRRAETATNIDNLNQGNWSVRSLCLYYIGTEMCSHLFNE